MLLAVCSVVATVYVPHLFSSYATRYGVIGAVFAMISAFFVTMVVIVGSAAAGREIHDELGRIRRGERPADDEVQRQWDQVTADARSRWTRCAHRSGNGGGSASEAESGGRGESVSRVSLGSSASRWRR